MTSNWHTPIPQTATDDVNNINSPLGQLDLAISNLTNSATDSGLFEARLTLLSTDPVPQSDIPAGSILSLAQYYGSKITVWDGTENVTFDMTLFSQPQVNLTGLIASRMYDAFVYPISAASLGLELLAWTNDTTRATDVSYQNGSVYKVGAPTRRWAGSFKTNSSGNSVADSQQNRNLFNTYNRKLRKMQYADATGHAYNTATWRNWNNSAVHLMTCVFGQLEDAISATLNASWVGTGNSGVAISLNAAALPGEMFSFDILTAGTFRNTARILQGQMGYNTFQAGEIGNAAGTTFNSFSMTANVLI